MEMRRLRFMHFFVFGNQIKAKEPDYPNTQLKNGYS